MHLVNRTPADTKLVGGGLSDSLFDLGGNSRLFGGAGNDFISAGAGDDVLDPGADGAKMYGGLGADTFHFGTERGASVVADFDPAQGDRLEFVGSARAAQVLAVQGGFEIHFDAGIGGFDWASGSVVTVATGCTAAQLAAATSWGADAILP
jgi:Ca2+-binding RTX toxin-like protein